MTQRLLKVRVTLKGREVKTYTFDQDVVAIGRCPDADIFLDNPGVSRNHLKLEATPEGLYAFEDLGSANGTYLNDRQTTREILQNKDVLRVGKFSLWIAYEGNLNGSPENGSPQSSGTFEGTTVLSKEERERLLTSVKNAERTKPESGLFPNGDTKEQAGTAGTAFLSPALWGVMVVVGILLGVVVGWVASRMFLP
jgi:pSer/pThr/pTyr-binding forkhead associated (FHA) protein